MKNRIFYLSYQLFLLILIPILLTGCAITDEGATDYRYMDRSSSPDNFTKLKYIKPGKDNLAKYTVKSGDPLVISLKQVFIKDFVEFRSPLRWVRFEPANGEVAIVVNAFEVDSGKVTNFGPNGKKNARVVFFSDDVWEGQFLNLSNLSTIFGPLEYKGNPFILDLYIVEMDTPGPQLRQLLANLAAIGSTFYPPASPLAGPLAQLAGTLITDDQDDRAYHFTAEFKSSKGGDANLNTGLLLTGDYVFIRERKRLATTDWSKLSYDEKNGKIIYKNKKNGTPCSRNPDEDYDSDCYYKENSYVVVEVNTAETAVSNETQQMLYHQLTQEVSDNTAPIFKSSVDADNLSVLATQIISLRSADLLKRQLRILLKTDSSNEPRDKEKGIALNKFVSLWTAKDKENEKLQHTIIGKELNDIEDLLMILLSSCPSHTQTNVIFEHMDTLRDRKCKNEPNLTKCQTEMAKILICRPDSLPNGMIRS